MRTRAWLGIVGGATMALGAAACGLSNDAASAFASGGRNEEDGGLASDSPSAFSDAGNAILQDNAVLLVHAATGPAFRLCFENAQELKPQPDATLMPGANVVGVDVGSAVRINPLSGTAGRIFYFSEQSIREIYGPGQAALTCKQLLATSGTAKLATELTGYNGDLHTGIHILALTGCAPETPTVKYSKAECGDTYDGKEGSLALQHVMIDGRARQNPAKLPSQLIDFSQQLELAKGARKVQVLYGDLSKKDEELAALATDPAVATVTPSFPKDLTLDTSAPTAYEQNGFRVSYDDGTKIVDQSLASINRLSAPRELPTDYYTTGSSYLFMLLGAPAPAFPDGGGTDPDELRNVHILAVPIVIPNFDAGTTDAGTGSSDAGSPDGST